MINLILQQFIVILSFIFTQAKIILKICNPAPNGVCNIKPINYLIGKLLFGNLSFKSHAVSSNKLHFTLKAKISQDNAGFLWFTIGESSSPHWQ
ncbi:unnamed protein product [Blepharisma stoltei]|uniref:Uncharacterized protein n=1 Tax=Blepharisma stoltei TaxID=1481888 RepID=A0AAU9KFN2_9CILI|nr:unnamed protein product [Blepharisma stoltei]